MYIAKYHPEEAAEIHQQSIEDSWLDHQHQLWEQEKHAREDWFTFFAPKQVL